MGQKEILELLKKKRKPLGRAEIAKELGEKVIKISDCLRKLLKHKEVKCVEIDRFQAMKRFGSKRRTRLYYV